MEGYIEKPIPPKKQGLSRRDLLKVGLSIPLAQTIPTLEAKKKIKKEKVESNPELELLKNTISNIKYLGYNILIKPEPVLKRLSYEESEKRKLESFIINDISRELIEEYGFDSYYGFESGTHQLLSDNTIMGFENSGDKVKLSPTKTTQHLNANNRIIDFNPIQLEITPARYRDGVLSSLNISVTNILNNQTYITAEIEFDVNEMKNKEPEKTKRLKTEIDQLVKKLNSDKDFFRQIDDIESKPSIVNKDLHFHEIQNGSSLDKEKINKSWKDINFYFIYTGFTDFDDLDGEKGSTESEKILPKEAINIPDKPILLEGNIAVCKFLLPIKEKNLFKEGDVFYDGFGNKIEVTDIKENNIEITVYFPLPIKEKEDQIVPIKINLEKFGFQFEEVFYQHANIKALTIEGVDICCRSKSIVDQYKSEISYLVKGVRFIEDIFNIEPKNRVRMINITSDLCGPYTIRNNNVGTINIGIDHIKKLKKTPPGNLNIMDVLFTTGIHEAIHLILKDKNRYPKLMDFLSKIPNDFLRELAEGQFIPAHHKRMGHPHDNVYEFLATFVVVATHRLTKEKLKTKNDEFKDLFYRCAYEIITNIPIKPNTKIFNILSIYSHEYSPVI